MRRFNKKVTIFSLIIIMLFIVIWYRLPVKRSITTTLCSVDGEKISVDFDLSWHRYIFRPTEIRGTIKIDNNTYYYIKKINQEMYSYYSFLERLSKKLNNDMNAQWFTFTSNNPFDILENNIQLLHVDKDFETIYITVKKPDNITAYYGPAESALEAELIYSEIYK